MKRIISALFLGAALLLCSMASAQTGLKYTGATLSQVTGKEETCKDLILNAQKDGGNISASLSGYELLGVKGIAITGKLVVDDSGKIVSWSDMKVTGVPAKIKDVTGSVTSGAADITLEGKSMGIIAFTVRYTGKATK